MNMDALHASICAALGAIGLVILTVACMRRQVGSEQPSWDDENSNKTVAPPLKLGDRIAFSFMIAVISLTLVASVATIVIAAHH